MIIMEIIFNLNIIILILVNWDILYVLNKLLNICICGVGFFLGWLFDYFMLLELINV